MSEGLFLGFAGLVTAVSVWSIWGGDMFPAEKDPAGGTNILNSSCASLLTNKILKPGQSRT